MNVWKKTLFAGVICACAAGAVILTGCNDGIEGNEQNHPVYIQAKADKDAGKYKEAADGLISLLNQAPTSAFLHKELAGLYQDNLCEYHLAIYHYERYLKLAQSLSSDDERAFRDLIANCKKEAAKQAIAEDPGLAGNFANTAPSDAHIAEVGKLQMQLDRYKQFRELYQDRDTKLKQLQAELDKKNASATAKPAAPAPAAPAVSETPAAPAAPAAPAPSGEFDEYVVKSGDSLSKIARKTYGSAAKRYLDVIRNANGLKNDNIRLNQKLKLPKLK